MRKKKKATPRIRSSTVSRKKKVVKKKAAVKKVVSKVPKTRGGGSLTEAAFWGMIKSALRKQSRWWKPTQNVKNKARRDYTGPNKRQKFEYQCNSCKNWFPATEVQVDHIEAVGSLQCCDDLAGVVNRLFCEEEGLQVLCSTCHGVKSVGDILLIKQTKRKKNETI